MQLLKRTNKENNLRRQLWHLTREDQTLTDFLQNIGTSHNQMIYEEKYEKQHQAPSIEGTKT